MFRSDNCKPSNHIFLACEQAPWWGKKCKNNLPVSSLVQLGGRVGGRTFWNGVTVFLAFFNSSCVIPVKNWQDKDMICLSLVKILVKSRWSGKLKDGLVC